MYKRFLLAVFIMIIPFKKVLSEEISQESGETGIWSEFTSFYKEEVGRNILYTGAIATGLLLATKNQTVDKFQTDMSTHQPLGEYAKYGDYMGQLVPNVLYMGGMMAHSYFSGDEKSSERAALMFKATAYSGLTTNILKRAVGEERPNGGDNLSFPSGHTTTAFAFASVVASEHGSGYGTAAYLLAAFVGLSRINDNAHHLHDVIAGGAIGAAYGHALHARLQKKRRSKNRPKIQHPELKPMPENPERTEEIQVTPMDSGLALGLKISY